MKKISIFLMMLCFACFGVANAQSTQDWGSSSTNSGYDYNANPFGRYYGYEYRVYLYPPNTMPFAGNITQLEFLPNGTLSAGGQIDVWMKTVTDVTSLSSSTTFATYKTGATQVYTSSSSPAFNQGEYVAIPLSTPIAYNNTNNEYLMILVRSEATSASGDGGRSFYYYNPGGASNNTWWAKKDNSDPGESATPSSFAIYGTGAYLPVVRFTYTGTAIPTISLSPSSATVKTGFTQTLTAIYGNVTNPTITYSSSDNSVATVTGSGTTATVTGVSAGTATITATMNGSYTATCAITVEDPSYCTPAPTSVDGSGITNVTFGTGTVVNDNLTMNSSPYYYDHSNMIGGAAPGSTVEMSITYATDYTYYTWVWVDWNNNYEFEEDELMYPSSQTISSGILSLQFNIPSSVTFGDYRMRIQGADGSSKKNPCYTSTYSYLVDYTLRVSSDPTIGLTPATAKILTGSTETITATVVNVSGTPSISYSSSNTSVATVIGNGTTATVTGVSTGTATITATMTVNGTNYTATCAVTVADLSGCEGFETDLGFWTVTTENSSFTWARTTGTGYTSSAGTGDYNAGAHYSSSLYTYTWLTLSVDLSSYTDKKISFQYINPAWGSDVDDINLQYSTDGSTYTTLQSYTSGTSDWTQVTDLAIPDEAKYIRFEAHQDYGRGVGLDEICLDYSIVTCAKPTDLVVSDITTNSAKLAWTPGGDETSWEYLCIDHGDTPDWTSQNVITSFTHSNVPANILAGTGQQPLPDTEYDFYVRANCGGGDYSTPAMISFTTLESACSKPTNVTASNLTINSAHIGWDGTADSYNVKYATATITGTTLEEVFFDDFENGFDNWTTYALGDYTDDTWALYNETSLATPHSGSYAALTRSYYNGTDVSVDNWLVSPQMTLGDVLKFWVVGDNNNYQEYFAVYVSTGTNATDDFVMVESPELAPGDGSWAERTVDLSAYAGQVGYIAIRHTDFAQDFLILDDFGVYKTVNTYSYGTFTTLPPTSETSCDITGLNPETLYVAQVQADCGGTDGTSSWSSVHFTTPDACSAPTDLVSSNITSTTATLGWSDNQDSYNVQYRKVYFFEGFEGETLPTGWTTIDANEDGNTWGLFHVTTHSGNNAAANLSYIYGTDDTTPDDYLVSPQLDLQGTLRVWLSGITASTYAEHFEILLSTTGNSVEDFTITLVAEAETTNEYVEYTADLSSYEGLQGYIAIHHFNCTDQRYLYVDDFGLYGTENWVSVNPNPTDATTTLTGLSTGTGYEWQVQGNNCDGEGGTTDWSDAVTFTTLILREFVTQGDWNVATNWSPEGLPEEGADVIISAPATIPANYLANVGHVTLGTNGAITIADGGQLRHTNTHTSDDVITVTLEKVINGFGTSTDRDHYYFIAPAPFYNTISPSSVANLQSNNYDFYSFSASASDGLEWINLHDSNNSLKSAHGYLYANSETVTLRSTGKANSINGGASIQANYNGGTYDFDGWNLAGNPYVCNAYVYVESNNSIVETDFYLMNEDGNGYDMISSTDPIKPFEGVFVYTKNAGSIRFSVDPIASKSGMLNMNLNHNGKRVDMSRLRFGQGQNLAKMSFRENSSKIYMPVEGKDYAIVSAESNMGEMPVSFKAENNGSYTLCFNAEEVSFAYLHLIDNLTGNDVNLLETPSYSFEAKTTDYASRFKLVFATGSSTGSDTFAFYSNGNWVINNEAEATLQVMDVTGRIIKSESINGCANVNLNAAPGVYTLRLINGENVRVQKVVVR